MRIVETAKKQFGAIDALVNNAGIYFSKAFTEYTVDDLRRLTSVNIEGFLFITQLAIKQMVAQKTNGCIVNITASLADHPIAGATPAFRCDCSSSEVAPQSKSQRRHSPFAPTCINGRPHVAQIPTILDLPSAISDPELMR
jgi:NAD(P)-dependent dehydrogenase (short-subunit alcohol dehydrogenase family)